MQLSLKKTQTVLAQRGIVFNREVHWQPVIKYEITPHIHAHDKITTFQAMSLDMDDPLKITLWGRYLISKDIYVPHDSWGFGFPISGMIFRVLQECGRVSTGYKVY